MELIKGQELVADENEKVVVGADGNGGQGCFLPFVLGILSAGIKRCCFSSCLPPFDRNCSARQLGSWDRWTFLAIPWGF